jgi:hypothetical protein
MRIHLVVELTYDLGIVLHVVMLGHFHMPPANERFYHHEQIASAFAFVFVICAFWLRWPYSDGRQEIDMQNNRLLIQAESRVLRVTLLPGLGPARPPSPLPASPSH